MKKSIKLVFCFLFMSIICISLSSCGSNLFSVEDETYDNLNDQLAHAETNEELEDVITQAEQIISNPSSTTVDIQQALVVKGQSILKQQGVDSGVILAQLIPLVDASKSSTGDVQLESVNIFDLIDVSNYDMDALTEAAESFNGASNEDLFAALIALKVISSVEASVLSSNDQYYRGLCNMTIVIKIVDTFYNVETTDDGIDLIPRDDSQTNLYRLTQMMEPDRAGQKSITFYAHQAIDGFEQADVFDVEVKKSLNKIGDAADNIEDLYDATKGEGDGGYIFTIGSSSYDFEITDESLINTYIEDALVEILESISI